MSFRRAAVLCAIALNGWACSEPSGPHLASITVIPSDANLVVGDTMSLHAIGLSAGGDTINAFAVSWSSADSAVATVSAAGVVTARRPGTVAITAANGAVAGRAGITVNVHFASITTGFDHSCGLTADGTAYCWGENFGGQLGIGTIDPQGSPRQSPQAVAGDHRFRAVAAGFDFTCGVTTDSLAWCWGYNRRGVLGAGLADTFAHPTPLAVLGGHRFQQINVSSDRACAVTSNGVAYCWGWNWFAANGTATPIDSIAPIPQPLVDTLGFTTIATGYAHTCALTVMQQAYCWGANESGELGYVTDSVFRSPLPVADTLSFSAIAAGATQACGRTGAGVAYCWGWEEFGEGAVFRRSPESVASALQLSQIAVSDNSCGLDQTGAAWCWGSNWLGELGDGTTQPRFTPVAVVGGHTFNQISLGISTTCGVTSGGAAYCWGSDYAGSLGRGFLSQYDAMPGPALGGISFTAVSIGSGHLCGLATDSTAWCWGSNYDGQLGDSTKIDRWQPTAVHGGLKFVALAVGGSDPYEAHSCGLTAGGAAYCWGNGAVGQLGTGSTASSTVPVPVSGGFSFTRITAGGDRFTCAVGPAGTAYCWGRAPGLDTTSNSGMPVLVDGTSGFDDLAAGRDFLCGHTSSGSVSCWGRNTDGELGQGYLGIESRRAHLVQGSHSFIQVSVGAGHSCALQADSTAWCWGHNNEGELGTGNLVSSITPRAVTGGLHFSSVSAGYEHSCGLTTNGAAYCWGYGAAPMPTPTQIQPGTVFRMLVSGPGSRICGLGADSVAVCFASPFGSAPRRAPHLTRRLPVLLRRSR